MIWAAPGVTQPGSTSDRPVNLLDIYPTLAALTGLEPPENQLEGNDLTVLMEDPGAAWDETTVTTFGYKNYGVRSERYRYIVYADGSEELYDHEQDKWEWHNLADDPEYAAIKEQMRQGIPAHHEPLGITMDQLISKEQKRRNKEIIEQLRMENPAHHEPPGITNDQLPEREEGTGESGSSHPS
jgi:arylsulfatase A-like enzyme